MGGVVAVVVTKVGQFREEKDEEEAAGADERQINGRAARSKLQHDLLAATTALYRGEPSAFSILRKSVIWVVF